MSKEYTSPELLKSMATHFAPRDWDWTRKLNFDPIHFHHSADKRRAMRRLAWGSILKGSQIDRNLFKKKRNLRSEIRFRIGMFKAHRDETESPDGRFEGTSVISFWEEDGEYIQMVQPTVGSLLADFLIAEPDHPHAKIITAELDRIVARYDERIKNGEVDGRKRTN